MEHAALQNIVDLGPYFSINKAVIWMWVAAFLAFITIYMAGKKEMVPGRYQSFVELLLTLIRQKMVLDTMGHAGLPYFPLIASLFFFVFFCNIVGVFPLGPLGHTATSDINVTATLAVLVLVIVVVTGVRKKGIYGYFVKGFIPHGVPWYVIPLIYPVEIISLLAKHFALAVRLFANMLAGHQVLLVFTGGAVALFAKGIGWKLLGVLPFLGVVGMLLFEIFVALIQSFIFAILTSLYIGDSLREHH
ncbi:F0F1 ATP synthase subunit A [Candidatus Poribacteria bacterium]|nr:F0F1 ATP synthase subunit A [Candidatus Poribacteria bacterium]